MSNATWALIGLGTVVVIGGVYLASNHKKKSGGSHYRGDITNPTKIADDVKQGQQIYNEGAQIASYFA